MSDPIEADICISKHYPRWRRNRDFIEGEFAVRLCGIEYLPACPHHYNEHGRLDPILYGGFNRRAEFLPVASRILECFEGLLFRKDAILAATEIITALCERLTGDRTSLDDLAKRLVRETFATNFTGLWVDHPPIGDGVSEADKEALGLEPYVELFPAETILEIRKGLVNNRRQITYVRLLANCDTVRELAIIDGVYTITDIVKVGTMWTTMPPVTPMKGGKTLNAIPFILVTTKPGTITPQPAEMDNIVALNAHHFQTSGDLANAMMWTSNPIVAAIGVEEGTQLSLVPGSYNIFNKPKTEVDIIIRQFDGQAIPHIQAKLDQIEEHISQVGMRIMASEKAAAEAAETLAIRRAGETSVLASHANLISRKLTEALTWVSFWIDGGDVSYQLNTDYDPSQMDAPTLVALTSATNTNVFPLESYYEALVDGEVIRPTLSFDEFKSRLEEDAADRPKTAPVANPLTGMVAHDNSQ